MESVPCGTSSADHNKDPPFPPPSGPSFPALIAPRQPDSLSLRPRRPTISG
ncbi:unnamed protein product, partial [Allacma fusca]